MRVRFRGSPALHFILQGNRKPLAVLSLVALATAFCETLMLAAVVQSIAAMTGGRTRIAFDLGPASLSIGIRTVLTLAVGAALLRACGTALVAMMGPRMTAESRERHRRQLFRSYLSASWETQSADKSGRLLQTLSSSVNEANTIISMVSQAIPAFVTLTVMLSLALVINPVVTACMGLFGMLIGLASWPVSARAQAAARADAAGRNATASHVAGVLAAGAEIAVFGVGQGVARKGDHWIGQAEGAYARAIGLKRLVATSSQSIAFISAATALLVLHLGQFDVDFAAVGTITVLLLRAAGLAQQVQSATSQYGAVVPFVDQVRETIEHYRSRRRSFGSARFPPTHDLSLQGVTYAYPSSPQLVVSVDQAVFAQGSFVAVIGPSGSGKSTLIQLMLRLRVPSQGTITIGGVPMLDIAEDELSAHMAYVPQSPHLVPGTVRDNIRFWRDGISDAQVISAARTAHVHDDIEQLDQGYDTMLDSHVDALSGGQKQRLALARALVTTPRILILDEPTSALDARNEKAVMETLTELRGEVTVIIVTHRTSMVGQCDRVLRLEDGELKQVGVRA